MKHQSTEENHKCFEKSCKTDQSTDSVHIQKDRPPRCRPKKEPVVLSWSGGKDSTMALYHLISSQKYEVVALITTVTEAFDRISIHGVRRELLELQADSLGIPLRKIFIPKDCTNELYELKMQEEMTYHLSKGVNKVVFGDLFLEDLKLYRDERLTRIGMKGVYPVWMRDTEELIRTFIRLGFKAILSCVDTQALDASFAGREIDECLLRDLPETVDPCGEYGEFHSFVYDGPIFKKPIPCVTGKKVMRASRFNYCDILPVYTSDFRNPIIPRELQN